MDVPERPRHRGCGRLPQCGGPARKVVHRSVGPARLPFVPGEGYRETLAGFLATLEASKLYPLADHTVLILSDCMVAISALRKGSFRSPALQNVALLFNRQFLDVGASQPHFLHAPGVVMKAEGVPVDDLSRSAARARRVSESLAPRRRIVV